MTHEEILQKARDAGLVRTHPGMAPEVLAFAAMIAADTRRGLQAEIEKLKAEAAKAEKWRGLACSAVGASATMLEIQREAADEMREACAKTVEGFNDPKRDWVPGSMYDNLRREVAAQDPQRWRLWLTNTGAAP